MNNPTIIIFKRPRGPQEETILEACAALVEAAGCVCEDLNLAGCFKGVAADWSRARTDAWTGTFVVLDHDPRCPVARAAKIRGRA